ncbi:MAG: hypothetical protein SA378_01060 [Sedimentibacter sp.]|uniref:hypothetical protein n=1 Tax=Sedimentibacter sp. TaxID=1960295 RepID=UPI002981C4B2|nr:hypothetical protein [Sedimentibacter sp.]MDW5298720.1 hypothetical protein [Sedimentibacter sp.]
MLFGKNRVEKDLEKIRRANLPSEYKNDEEQKYESAKLKLEKNDLLAMILAVFSLVLPYFIAFVAIMTAVVFLLGYLY